MLGTVLISGLLLSSPDTTTGFTLVPKHTVFLDRTYPSFSEIVAAREGIYDLGVGSIHIPLEDGTFQLAIIVYGSEQAQLLQYQRVEDYLQRNLQSVELATSYFGTPYGKLRKLARIETKSVNDSLPESIASVIDRDEAILDSILNVERQLATPNESKTTNLLGDDSKNQEVTSLIAADNGTVPLDLLNRNVADILKSSEPSNVSIPVSTEPVLNSVSNELPVTKNEPPNNVLNQVAEIPKSPIPPVTQPSTTEAKVSVAKSEIAKGVTQPAPSSPKQINTNPEVNTLTNESLSKRVRVENVAPQIARAPEEKSVPAAASASNPSSNNQLLKAPVANKAKSNTSKDLFAPKPKESPKSSVRKPFREISVEPQVPGKFYIVFGHFDNKTNAQYYARSVRKTFDEVHISPSNQGFRVLMLADQAQPIDQLREIRLSFPKAWLIKPRRPKLE